MNDFKFPQLEKLTEWFVDTYLFTIFEDLQTTLCAQQEFKDELEKFISSIIADTVAIVERKEK